MPGTLMMAKKTTDGKYKQLETNDSHHLKTHDTDVKAVLDAILVDTDAADSSLNTIEANSTLQASRLSNIQDWVGTADGAGGGDKLGVVMSNILTKQTDNNQKTQILANSVVNGSGSQYHICSTSAGEVHISAPNGVNINALNDASASQSVRTNGSGSVRTATQKTTGEWLASGAIADDNYSAALDCSTFKHVRLFGKWTGSTTNMPILVSQTTSGTYYALAEVEWITQVSVDIGGSTEYHIEAVIENVGNFIKIYNQSGGSKTLEVDYVGISN